MNDLKWLTSTDPIKKDPYKAPEYPGRETFSDPTILAEIRDLLNTDDMTRQLNVENLLKIRKEYKVSMDIQTIARDRIGVYTLNPYTVTTSVANSTELTIIVWRDRQLQEEKNCRRMENKVKEILNFLLDNDEWFKKSRRISDYILRKNQ